MRGGDTVMTNKQTNTGRGRKKLSCAKRSATALSHGTRGRGIKGNQRARGLCVGGLLTHPRLSIPTHFYTITRIFVNTPNDRNVNMANNNIDYRFSINILWPSSRDF